jgi:uncharacterized protein (DUF433 family)
MIDNTSVATEITGLIAAGKQDRELVAEVTQRFPDITSAELSQALQVATTQAERRISRRH